MGSPPTAQPGINTYRPYGLQNAVAVRELVISPSADPNDLNGATTLNSGNGAPTHTRGNGSEYWDNDTGTKYRRASGIWAPDSGGGIEILANASGAGMSKGDLVYPSSHDGTNWVITLATNVDVDSRAIWVLLEDIANGVTGAGAGIATITGLNTSAYSLAGVKLYLDTAGALVEAVPTGSTVIVQECAEVKVKSATVGELSYYPALAMLQGIEVSDLMGVTATAAELNYNDLTGAVGTVEASKAVVVDANKDISEFRNIGAALLTRDSNNLNISTTTTGSVEVDGIDGVAVESSSGPISIGADAAAEAVNIATGAAARVITVGNAASASLAMEAGVGGATLNADTTIALDAGGALAGAIVIDASNAAGGIDIDAGTGGIAIDSTGVISIEGVGASDLTTDTGDLTLATTTSGDVKADSAANVVLEPAAGSNVLVNDGTDPTKQTAIVSSGITTGNVRTLAMADIDVSLEALTTAPTLTPGAEAADVITVAFASPVASVERYLATLVRDADMEVATAAFRMAETGVGAEVSPTAMGRLLFTTDANGAAGIACTDVAGASGETCWLFIEPMFASADQAQACAPVSVSITFD